MALQRKTPPSINDKIGQEVILFLREYRNVRADGVFMGLTEDDEYVIHLPTHELFIPKNNVDCLEFKIKS